MGSRPVEVPLGGFRIYRLGYGAGEVVKEWRSSAQPAPLTGQGLVNR
jgi:hypothetical protein